MILIEDIKKQYLNTPVLKGLSLEVRNNQVVALIGPSGCGKTTLLRLIAGLETPDQGTIAIDDRVVSSPHAVAAPKKRQLAMIFQDLALWPHMTVRQHLEFVLRQRNGHHKTMAAKTGELLCAVDLTGYAGRYPHQLSGGEQQRLAVARALAQDPHYLLMDEPFSNVDPIIKSDLECFLGQLTSATEMGVIYVTHNIEDIRTIAERVAIMHEGRLVQAGRMNEVFEHPANDIVRKLLNVNR